MLLVFLLKLSHNEGYILLHKERKRVDKGSDALYVFCHPPFLSLIFCIILHTVWPNKIPKGTISKVVVYLNCTFFVWKLIRLTNSGEMQTIWERLSTLEQSWLCVLHKAKKTGAWKVKLFGIFQNPKPKEVAKTYTNIICTYLKNVYFY